MEKFHIDNPIKSLFIHFENVDDILLILSPDLISNALPILKVSLAKIGLILNYAKCKVLIPSATSDCVHPLVSESGFVQVFGSLELLDGAIDRDFCMNLMDADSDCAPPVSIKRVLQVETLAEEICDMIRSSLSRPARRAIWTLIDKVLNRALNYDARILYPELFSPLAARLDTAVRTCLLKILDISQLDSISEANIRLGISFGGCGIYPAKTKSSFGVLAASS